jgi:hypothetical protein
MLRSSAVAVIGLLAAAAPAARSDTPAHDLLRRMAGTWNATMQVASAGDEPPMVINGTEVSTLGGDGAWLVSDFRSQIEGRPFQGHGLLARDAKTGRYRRVWADSTSPAFWSSEGTYDAATDSLTLWIETTDSDGHPVRWREVVSWKGDDMRTFTMFVPGPETREAAGVSIVYRRRRDAGGGLPLTGPVPSPPSGSPYAVLARAAGTWKAVVEDRTGTRGRSVSKGIETGALCCDGQFLVTELAGSGRGQSFTAHGLFGYDPQRKKYVRASIDSVDRTLTLTEGDYDAAADALTLRVPLSDGQQAAIAKHEVFGWKGPDERSLKVLVPGAAAQASPGRTIEYKRVRN